MNLNGDTKITLAVAVLCLSTAVGGTWKVSTAVNQLQRDVAGSYTLAAASEQALRMAIENPGLRVPDPRDPSKIITTPSKGN